MTAVAGSRAPPGEDAPVRRWSLTVLLAVSMLFTVCVAITAPAWDAYMELVARDDAFGVAAVCGGVIMATLVVVLLLREVRSFMRLRRIEGVRRTARALRNPESKVDSAARDKAARRVLRGVIALYRSRAPGSVKLAPLVELKKAKTASADTILQSIEANALAPLDDAAMRIVKRASLRVGTFTAISPWGALDMVIVAYMNLVMIRALAQHYNARPGLLSTLKMSMGYVVGIGASGAISMGATSILAHLGNRVAGYLIGALAKGSVNATSTALLGLLVVQAVRPIPFEDKEKPGLLDLVFPSDGMVARTIDKVADMKEHTIVAVQGLVGRNANAGSAPR